MRPPITLPTAPGWRRRAMTSTFSPKSAWIGTRWTESPLAPFTNTATTIPAIQTTALTIIRSGSTSATGFNPARTVHKRKAFHGTHHFFSPHHISGQSFAGRRRGTGGNEFARPDRALAQSLCLSAKRFGTGEGLSPG